MDNFAERTNTFAQQHFGFSPAALTDSVHNIIVENWATMVEDIAQDPALPNELRTKEFSKELMQSLLKDNLLVDSLSKFEEYVKRYVLRIPEHVTLPEHQDNLELPADYNPKKLDEEIKALERELVKKRVILAQQDAEERDIHDAIRILKTMNDAITCDDEVSVADMTTTVERLDISQTMEQESINQD